jgi:hypothetical protein
MTMTEPSVEPVELKKETESEDPYAFVALRYETEPGVDPDAAMARCVTEEFAMMGFSPERILRLFQLATYAGVYAIYERRGEAFVRAIIEDVFGTALAPVVGLASDGEVM